MKKSAFLFLIVGLLAVFGFAGIALAGNGSQSLTNSLFCEAPTISVKDQLGQPVEDSVISVTYNNGSETKTMDVTTPVSGTVTLSAASGTYTFELKSVPASYSIGNSTKIVQDCQDGKAIDAKSFAVINNAASAVTSSSASGTSVNSVDFNPVFNFNAVQNLAFILMEQNPEFKAYVVSLVQETTAQDTQVSENVVVPTLTGLTQNEAKTALANAGLLLGDVRFVADGDSRVVEQSISSGSSVARNSTVDLVVSIDVPLPTPPPTPLPITGSPTVTP